jgi:hypothetical protein
MACKTGEKRLPILKTKGSSRCGDVKYFYNLTNLLYPDVFICPSEGQGFGLTPQLFANQSQALEMVGNAHPTRHIADRPRSTRRP